MNPHDKFEKVREVERVTWRDYLLAIVVALAFLYLIGAFI